jgi:hypothetical protein
MKSLRVFLVSLACAWLALPALAAVELDPRIGYRPGLASDDAACEWEPGIAAAARKRAEAAFLPAGAAPAEPNRKLSLQVIRYELTRWEKKSQYLVGVRADVTEGGRLVATRDFQYHDSFRNEKPGCDTLKSIGASLGGEVGKWMQPASFMECGEGCTGIHPDEPIALGAEVEFTNPEAVKESIRNECRFPAKLVDQLLNDFNRIDYPPQRAKLVVQPELKDFKGRRLILRVHDVHALAGLSFTGPKWMTMSGELREGEVTVASFSTRVSTGRGGFTVCGTVDSLSDSTVWLIVQWLRGPTLGANLVN